MMYKCCVTNIMQVDLAMKRLEIEVGFGVVLSEEYPGVVIDSQRIIESTGKH